MIKDNEKESSFHKKVQISLRGLKRKAIENITQVDMNIINEKLLCLLEEEE